MIKTYDEDFDPEDDFDKGKIGMCCACGRQFLKSETTMVNTHIGLVEMCYQCADEIESIDD
jgi:hypothetical protein